MPKRSERLSEQAKLELDWQLRLLYSSFNLFAQNKYTIGAQSDFFRNKKKINLDGLLKARVGQLLTEGRAYSTYRYFQIMLCDDEALPEYFPSCARHRDFYFILTFIRYEENAELISEIKKLGEICSFSFTEIEKNRYLISFDS